MNKTALRIRWLLWAAVGALLFAALAAPVVAHPLVQDATQGGLVVDINGPAPDANKQAFVGKFVVNDPNQVGLLRYRVEDAEEGVVRIGDTDVNLGGFPAKMFSIPFGQLQEGHKYILKVYGFDRNNEQLQRADDSASSNPADRLVLASKQFVYSPLKTPVFSFTIDSVNLQPDHSGLTFNLTVPVDFEVLKYDGYIVDEGGQQVGAIPSALFTGPAIGFALPQTMRTATEPGKYRVALRLYTQAGEQSEQAYEFIYRPPPRPGLIARISAGLVRNPGVGLLIVGVPVAAIAATLWQRRRSKQHLPPLQRPQSTLIASSPSSVRRPRVRVRVVESPGATRGRQEVVTRFPFVIGQGEKADFRVSDPRVSRRHLEVSWQDGYFYLTDLNSKNGTWVNDAQLRASGSKQIAGTVSVRLGEDTVLDLETGV